VSAPLLSPLPDDYLLVTIFFDQTGCRKGTPPAPDLQNHVETVALLDTGSLAGDFSSQHVVTQSHGESLSYVNPHPTTVRSGLDSTCYSDAHLATHSVAITTFAVNSFVLVQYSSTPPTRLHKKWEGPFKIISSHLSEYTILNLVSKETRIVHASRLNYFVFNRTTNKVRWTPSLVTSSNPY
jgi:hypothetical protein